MSIHLGGRGPGHIARASAEAATDAPALPAAPEAATFSQSAKSTFQVFSDAISLRLGGLQYSGMTTAGDGAAALATSPDAEHKRDQLLKFSTAGGEGSAFASQDLRYQPHDADRDSFSTTSLVSMASGFWKASLVCEGAGGHFFAGYSEATNQATAQFQVGFAKFGGGWRVRVNSLAVGRVLPLSTVVEVKVAWTATTLIVSTRKQGETGWKVEYTGTGLSITALRSIRYGLWSPAYAASAVYFSDTALAETFDDIDRDFYLAGSGTRDVSQTQANIALVIPDGLFTGMNKARLRWAAGNDPTDGTIGSWVALSGKTQSVLPMSLTGLTHNTAYSYQFEIATSAGAILYTSNAYRFRTLANAGTAQAAELAFGSCHVQVPWGHPYVNDEYVTDTAGTAYLGSWHLGDQGYEAGALLPTITDGYPEMDPPESADDFEFQIRDWCCDTKLVPLFERGMYFCTPDDHQIINDFDARHKAGGSMANTLANSYTSTQSTNYGAGTKLSDLWPPAIAVFNAWFIDHWIDKPSSGVLYKHWTHGKVEIILLDTRTERYATSGEYISATQLAWVKDRIDNIAATTNLVLFVAQGAFSTYTSKASEGWERNADAQYEDFVDYCVANIDPAVNFAFINGDDHVGFNRHFIVKTAANPSMPVNFCGELRASGGSIGEFVTQGGHAEWWLPGTDNPSTNSFFRCSGALLSITADADAVTETMKVGSTIYTDTMLSSAAFTPAGVANLLEWWDASDNATAWSDTGATTPATAGSSNCAALTGKVAGTLLTGPTAPPTYVTDGTNGQKCLSFNSATPQRLSYIGSIITTAFSGDDTPFTVIFTAKRNAAGVLAIPVCVASSTGSTDPSQRFYISAANEAGSVRSTSGGASDNDSTTGAGIGAAWDTYTFCYTGSRLLVMVNDVLHDIVEHGVSAVETLDRLVVGCRYSRSSNTFTSGLNGSFGELFIIANRALTKDVLNLRDYLMAKWHN